MSLSTRQNSHMRYLDCSELPQAQKKWQNIKFPVQNIWRAVYNFFNLIIALLQLLDFECMTFAPAIIALVINVNIKHNPNPNLNPKPNLNLYPTPHQKPNHYPLSLCGPRYHQRTKNVGSPRF